MRRWFSVLAVVMALLAGSLSTVSAQDPATPVAANGATSSIIYGADGQPEGEITVNSVSDPFEDFDSSSPPQRGFHYAMAIVTITATGDRPTEASSYGFFVVDTDGFQYSPTYLFRAQESTDAIPDFLGGTVEPGQSMSGAVFFQVLDGTSIALVLYQPSFERLITAADLRDTAIAEGDAVSSLASDGSPAATITVDGTTSPLADVTSPPQRGFEYLGVSVTIENTGSQPLAIEPYNFTTVDAQGFVYTSYGLFRSEGAEAQEPSLAYGTILEAGASISGLVAYEVLAGTELGLVYYAPSFDRHIRIAEYADEQAPKPSGTPPVFQANPGTDDLVVDETPEVVANTPGCEGVIEWYQESFVTITTWSEAFFAVGMVLSGQTVEATVARDAADKAATLADAQREIDTPGIAEETQNALIDMYELSAEVIDELADALEANDTAGSAAAIAKLEPIGASVNEGGALDVQFTALTDACPEIENVQ